MPGVVALPCTRCAWTPRPAWQGIRCPVCGRGLLRLRQRQDPERPGRKKQRQIAIPADAGETGATDLAAALDAELDQILSDY